jgi:uncharacterized protein YkvS
MTSNIKFKDLSFMMKLAAIGGLIAFVDGLIDFCIGFYWGFISAW